MVSIFRSRSHRNAVYALMLERIECGPFDGGCVAFAMALQRIHGGEVHVVEGRSFTGFSAFRYPSYTGCFQAQHAVLALPDGSFMDAHGQFGDARRMLQSAAKEMKFASSAERLRPIEEGDLPEAPRTPEVVDALVELLRPEPLTIGMVT